jgi:hypothetical protein
MYVGLQCLALSGRGRWCTRARAPAVSQAPSGAAVASRVGRRRRRRRGRVSKTDGPHRQRGPCDNAQRVGIAVRVLHATCLRIGQLSNAHGLCRGGICEAAWRRAPPGSQAPCHVMSVRDIHGRYACQLALESGTWHLDRPAHSRPIERGTRRCFHCSGRLASPAAWGAFLNGSGGPVMVSSVLEVTLAHASSVAPKFKFGY